MGTGNAGDYQYESSVAFPFCYGLSYPQFLWDNMNTHYAPTQDAFEIRATVTNIGNLSGKEVVQIYARSPYSDYDRQMGVEKSAVILCGYGRTQLLIPSASETLTITVHKRELASFDTYGYGTNILKAGNNYLTAAKMPTKL